MSSVRVFWWVDPSLVDTGVWDYETLLSWKGGELVATARTRRTLRIETGGETFYLKIQYHPRWRPRYFARHAAYYREARAYERMRGLGLRVPQVVALGERRRLGFLIDALIVTRQVRDAVDLLRWSHAGFRPQPHLPPFEIVRDELERTVERIHRLGYRFGDLKWRNILAAPADSSGSHVVFLDQRRFGRRLRRREEVRPE
ncbi:MAG: lipopolysaccharide kinase InaA family protein [Planctomycetota bacterium]